MDVNDHNRILVQILPIIQAILKMENLNKFENSIIDLIEKQNMEAQDKFTNKKEILKSKIHGREKSYRLGISFSRILQGLNIDNTFNPFIQKSKDCDKKYKLSENCLSIKKVRKIATLVHVNSDIDVMKKQSFEETLEKDFRSYNRRNLLKNRVNIWGI
jgi:hypothetical protein